MRVTRHLLLLVRTHARRSWLLAHRHRWALLRFAVAVALLLVSWRMLLSATRNPTLVGRDALGEIYLASADPDQGDFPSAGSKAPFGGEFFYKVRTDGMVELEFVVKEPTAAVLLGQAQMTFSAKERQLWEQDGGTIVEDVDFTNTLCRERRIDAERDCGPTRATVVVAPHGGMRVTGRPLRPIITGSSANIGIQTPVLHSRGSMERFTDERVQEATSIRYWREPLYHLTLIKLPTISGVESAYSQLTGTDNTERVTVHNDQTIWQSECYDRSVREDEVMNTCVDFGVYVRFASTSGTQRANMMLIVVGVLLGGVVTIAIEPLLKR